MPVYRSVFVGRGTLSFAVRWASCVSASTRFPRDEKNPEKELIASGCIRRLRWLLHPV